MVHVTSDPDEQSGTGEPRSAAGPTAQAERGSGQQGSAAPEEAAARGAAADSQPAHSDEVTPNRSGSGGSGGPVTEDAPEGEEGSGARSMDEMLGGSEEAPGS